MTVATATETVIAEVTLVAANPVAATRVETLEDATTEEATLVAATLEAATLVEATLVEAILVEATVEVIVTATATDPASADVQGLLTIAALVAGKEMPTRTRPAETTEIANAKTVTPVAGTVVAESGSGTVTEAPLVGMPDGMMMRDRPGAKGSLWMTVDAVEETGGMTAASHDRRPGGAQLLLPSESPLPT